jgi:hypothetical protein|tara:strand:- start:5107 stop:5391 length:285 start_codon:yes stop_codon:yes gene_type:complete
MNNDIDGDGKIDNADAELKKKMLELQIREDKADQQGKMAWAAIMMTCVFTMVLLSEFVSIERITAMAQAIDWFYISMTSIVGVFMGVTAYATRK